MMFNRIILMSFALAAITIDANAQSSDTPSFDLEKMIACQAITTDSARLACFDENVGAFSQATKEGEIVTIKKETVEKVERESFGFNLPSVPKLSSLFGLGSKSNSTAVDAADLANLPNLPLGETVTTANNSFAATDGVKGDDTRDAEIKLKKRKKKKARRDASLNTQQVTLTINRVGRHQGRKLKFLFDNGQIWEQSDSDTLPSISPGKGKGKKVMITKGTLGGYFLRVNGKGKAIKVKRAR